MHHDLVPITAAINASQLHTQRVTFNNIPHLFRHGVMIVSSDELMIM